MTTSILRNSSSPAAPRLSVVVPCYNVGALAADAVGSLLRQTMAELEVIAVDDGSTDDSLAQLLRIDDSRLTCATQPNRGLAAARNAGIRLARAPYVGFCDGDDLWHPEKAAKQIAVMESDPSIGLTFSYSAYLDEDGTPNGQLLVTHCLTPTTRDLLARNHVGNGSTAIVRRECFERAGLFDESLESCEDIEMWVRLSVSTPTTLRCVPEPLTGYRVRRGSQMHTFEKYLAGSRLYLERFRSYVPGYGARDARRTFAEHLRILSRKAFSDGQVELSRRLLRESLRQSPTLVVRDARAFAMATLHLAAFVLPGSDPTRVYRLGRKVLGRAFALLYGAQSVEPWSRVQTEPRARS